MAFVPATPLVVHTNNANTVTVSNVVVTSLPANVVLVSGSDNTLTVSDVTTTELSYLQGLTGNIQDQINSIAVSGLEPNVVLVSNATGDLVTSNVTTTELGYLKGATSNIQQQLNDASVAFVGTPYDWVTNGTPLVATPLTFTPLPGRTYVVNAELGILANAADHTVTFGLQWPSPLYNANSGVVTALYQETASSSVIKRSSAYATPTWTFSTSTLANTLIMASLNAVFTTGSGSITPFTIVANTSDINRYVYLVYGSHVTYRSFTNTPNFLPVITTVLQPTYTLASNGAPTTLTLSATDPEGSPVTWSYEVVGSPIGNIATVTQVGNMFTVTPSPFEANAGSFTLRFGASDGSHTAYSTHATFTLPTSAPTIAPVESTYTLSTTGTNTIITLGATDAEGSPLTYSYQIMANPDALGNIANVSQATNVFTVAPSVGETYSGSFTLRFGVSDGIYTTYTNSAVFTKPSNPPSVTNINSSYTLSTTSVDTVITVSASDPEGTGLTYAYQVVSGDPGQIATVKRNGVAASPNVFAADNVFTIAPSAGETYAGSFTLRFAASDGTNVTYTNSAVFTKPSTAPTIISGPNASYTLSTSGDDTVITVTATDAEGTPLSYKYQVVSGALSPTASVLRNGVVASADVFASDNVFTIRPSTNTSNGGTFSLRFGVTDGKNTVYTNGASFSLNFDSTPPTITPINSSYTLATNGTATTITITATDPATPITYGYEVTSGSVASTATISQTSNVFTITPSTNSANAGSFALRFWAQDSFNNRAYTSSATFTLYFQPVLAFGQGTNDTIAYSTNNGISWTGLGKSVFTQSGHTAAYNGSMWVAGGNGGNTMAYSFDGINWNGLGTSVFGSNCLGVAWNGTRWVAVGGSDPNTIAYSNDGINWTGLGKSIFSSNGRAVAWNGTRFVAVGIGTNTIAYSNDGINWTGLGTSIFENHGRGVASNGTRFVAVGYYGNSIAYSNDGINWVGRGTYAMNEGYAVATNGSRWVAAGYGGYHWAYSDDGINWTLFENSALGSSGYAVAWTGTRWVAGGGSSNTLAYSDDGINWTGLGKSIFSSYVNGIASPN